MDTSLLFGFGLDLVMCFLNFSLCLNVVWRLFPSLSCLSYSCPFYPGDMLAVEYSKPSTLARDLVLESLMNVKFADADTRIQ